MKDSISDEIQESRWTSEAEIKCIKNAFCTCYLIL